MRLFRKNGTVKPVWLWQGLTLEAWQSSGPRVAWAKELFRSQIGREMITVLRNTVPVPDLSRPDAAALEAARVRGYLQAIAVLTELANPSETILPPIEADYGIEDTQQAQELLNQED